MILSSKRENILVVWLKWHFIEMPRFLFSIWENYLWFGLNYFSVPLLLVTLFSPWRRYNWKYPKSIFQIGELFSTLISNLFSRIIGAICRIILIILGIVTQIGIVMVGGVLLVSWILLPCIGIFAIWLLFTL